MGRVDMRLTFWLRSCKQAEHWVSQVSLIPECKLAIKGHRSTASSNQISPIVHCNIFHQFPRFFGLPCNKKVAIVIGYMIHCGNLGRCLQCRYQRGIMTWRKHQNECWSDKSGRDSNFSKPNCPLPTNTPKALRNVYKPKLMDIQIDIQYLKKNITHSI